MADQHVAVFRQRHADQIRMMLARDIDAELDLPVQHRLLHRRRRVIENLDAIMRIARRIRLQDARQILHAHRRHARNRHIAATCHAGFADFRERLGEFAQQAARLRQETAADFRERHGARGPLDQRDAEVAFELAQTLRNGGLRHMQRIGSALEAAEIRNGDERLNTERIDFH